MQYEYLQLLRINSDEILSLIKSLGGHTECKHVQDLVRACEINNGSLGGIIRFRKDFN